MRVVSYAQLRLLTSSTSRLFRRRDAQELVEYALLAALIALVSIGALSSVGTWEPIAASF